jgi:drug/metabolite transporter (DMT)-like permease
MSKASAGQNRAVGVLSLLGVGALFGISGVAAKYLSGYMGAYATVAYRFGFALLGALTVVVVSRKKISFGGAKWWHLAGFSVLFPLSVVLFVLSVFHASVAVAVFSFYSGTLLSSFVLGRIIFKERVGMRKGVALLIAITGLVILTWPLGHGAIGVGAVLGLVSGLVQGVASSLQKTLAVGPDRISLLVLQTGAGAVLAVICALIAGNSLVPTMPTGPWAVTAGYGLAMLAIAYLFLVGFANTNLNTGSILISTELLFGPLFAWVMLSESLGTKVLVAGACVAGAAVLANSE